MKAYTKEEILAWLEEVKDPEIPVLSLVDLGVITSLNIDNKKVSLVMTPTFVGCPALDLMKKEIEQKLKENGIQEVEISISFREPWSSDKITEKGREALMKFGLAPPPNTHLITDLDILEKAICPRCKGSDTILRSPFGTTLCRSIYYCNACQEAFEQFKPI